MGKKIKKVNRNETAVEGFKSNVSRRNEELIGVKKRDYIANLFNGQYYLARLNMMADQLNKGKILENIDGCPKTKEYMKAEYSLMRMRAIEGFRNAHFAKMNLKDSGLSDEDIEAIRLSYYEGMIIQTDYSEEEPIKKGAAFVDGNKK